jgi:SAM-dependent methyltransferase
MERIIPTALAAGEVTGEETLRLHVERYQWAARRTGGGRVLDLACGVGYGAVMLAAGPGVREVVAVDSDADAIGFAVGHYRHPRVSHRQSDGLAFGEPGAFDAVVSLETIEHVNDPERFFAHLVELVRPGGMLIASVPVTPSVDANPHHRTDFSRRSLGALGRRHGLVERDRLDQRQPWSAVDVLLRRERRAADRRRGLLGWYARHPDALARRLVATLRWGFVNHYRTQAWRRP